MRPNDPHLENSQIYSSEQVLGKLLSENFSAAASAKQGSDPEMDPYVFASKIKSGFHDAFSPLNALHDDNEDSPDKKNERESRRTTRFSNTMNRVEIFSHNGYSLNFGEVVESLDSIEQDTQDKLEEVQEEMPVEPDDLAVNAKTGNVFASEIQMEMHIQRFGSDSIKGGTITLDQTSVVDGVRVETEKLKEARELEEELKQIEAVKAQIILNQQQVADGTMTQEDAQKFIDDLPCAMKDRVTAAHAEIEQDRPTDDVIMSTAPVEVPAVMQEVSKVVATFAPAVAPEPSR